MMSTVYPSNIHHTVYSNKVKHQENGWQKQEAMKRELHRVQDRIAFVPVVAIYFL